MGAGGAFRLRISEVFVSMSRDQNASSFPSLHAGPDDFTSGPSSSQSLDATAVHKRGTMYDTFTKPHHFPGVLSRRSGTRSGARILLRGRIRAFVGGSSAIG